MDIWHIPEPVIFILIALFLYMGLVSRRVQRVAYNLAEHMAQKEGTGISSGSVGGFSSRITPPWVRIMVWIASFAALGMIIYVAMRYGWLWALGYAVGDHLAKTVEIPILPTVDQSYTLVEKQAERVAPVGVYRQITAHRTDYVHE